MQSLKQDRTIRPEVHKEVWCLKCKSQGHDKDHFPVFENYLVGGGPMPLRPESQEGPSAGPALWCAIYQVAGNMPQIIVTCYKSLYRYHNIYSTTFVGR